MADTSPAAPRDPLSPRHAIGEMVVDFTVSDPDAAMNSPEQVLVKARAELLPQLEAILDSPSVSTADASIEVLEIDLGVWPADPDWYAVRDTFREAFLSAINPYLRWHDDRSTVFARALPARAPKVKHGSQPAPVKKDAAVETPASGTGGAGPSEKNNPIIADVVSADIARHHSKGLRSDDPGRPTLRFGAEQPANPADGKANEPAQAERGDLQDTGADVTRIAAFRATLLELLRQARKHTTPATQRDVARRFERLLADMAEEDAQAFEGLPIARDTPKADAYIQEVIKAIDDEEVFLLSMVTGDFPSAASARREAFGTALKQLVDHTFRTAKAVLPPLKEASNAQGVQVDDAKETAATALQIAARDALRQHKSRRAFGETKTATIPPATDRRTDKFSANSATQTRFVADVRSLLLPLLTAAGHARLDAEAFLALLGFGETQTLLANSAFVSHRAAADGIKASPSADPSNRSTQEPAADHPQTKSRVRSGADKQGAETSAFPENDTADKDAADSVNFDGAASTSPRGPHASSDKKAGLGAADATRFDPSQQKNGYASGDAISGLADHSSGTGKSDQTGKRVPRDARRSAVDDRSVDPSGSLLNPGPSDLLGKAGRDLDQISQASDVPEPSAVPPENMRLGTPSGSGPVETTAGGSSGEFSPDTPGTTEAGQRFDGTDAASSAPGHGLADQQVKTDASGPGALPPPRDAVEARSVDPADKSSEPDVTRSAAKAPVKDPQDPADIDAGQPSAMDGPPVVQPYFASQHPEAVAKRQTLFDDIAPLVLDTLTSLPGAQRQRWRHVFDVIWSALPRSAESDRPSQDPWAVGTAVHTAPDDSAPDRQSTDGAADADNAPGTAPPRSEKARDEYRADAPESGPVFKSTAQRRPASYQDGAADRHEGRKALKYHENPEGATDAEPTSRAQTTGIFAEKAARAATSQDPQYLAALAELLGSTPGPDDDFAMHLDSILLRLFPQANARHRALRHLSARLGYADGTTSPVLRRQALAAVNEVTRMQNQTKAASQRREANTSQGDDVTAARAYLSQRSGLVLFATYLPLLFDRLGVLDENRKIKQDSLARARRALQLLGSADTPEASRTDPLEKTLLGLPQTWHFDKQPADPAPDGALINGLIEAVIKQWAALGQTSVAGMQDAFVKRAGALRAVEEGWSLTVEQGPFDMLLDRLPWSFDTIALPWTELPLHVTWRPRDD